MVAVINPSRSLRNSLHYNENKLSQKKAVLIHSANYGKDTNLLSFTDKIRRLERLAALNQATKVNSVHISLNFDPSEKIPVEKLREIAEAYMQKIGFGDQPYLVYQHHDSGHPHVHIVTTNIRKDGTRIKLHNIGRNQSEKARKEIEKEFNLVKAQREQLKQAYELKPVNVQKVQYGKSETKQAITNVLDAILPAYKYASLPELNAVLREYNVRADRGGENSRTYQRGGLVYRVLDEHGKPVGTPIKASQIYNKPTLKALQVRFEENLTAKQAHKQRVKNAIDLMFLKRPGMPLPELIQALEKEKIQVVLRQNANGLIYGMTYIDHQTKCVFNGSDLGKPYSANQMQERCKPEQPVVKPRQQAPKQDQAPAIEQPHYTPTIDPSASLIPLLQSEKVNNSLPYELRQDLKRKRKRKRLHL
jgi:Relaxase/Mobilisation nuclease domain